jgi:SAM-dependent methyltransferase
MTIAESVMYDKAGINDVSEFYREKFVHQANFDFTHCILNFFNLNHFKSFWIYAKVKPNSRVLDFGCGSGTLSALKQKGCHLTGVDYSASALEIARTLNHYDEVIVGDISLCELPIASFDYIVSLDVFGHIEFAHKDAVINRLKDLLKPNGTMLHGIECADIAYDQLSPEELAQFVQVDGHVGIEGKPAILQRFQRFFRNVRGEVRYDVINLVEEYLKKRDSYGVPLPPLLWAYLKSLSASEQEIFNICAGLAMHNLERFQCRPSAQETGGFLFLEASDAPLSPLELPVPESWPLDPMTLLHNDNVFFRGWYGLESDRETSHRWAGKEGFLYLPNFSGRVLRLSVFSYHPRIVDSPVEVLLIQIAERERLRARVVLYSHQPVEITIPVEYDHFILKIHATTTWIPRYYDSDSDDARELGAGVKWVYLN